MAACLDSASIIFPTVVWRDLWAVSPRPSNRLNRSSTSRCSDFKKAMASSVFADVRLGRLAEVVVAGGIA